MTTKFTKSSLEFTTHFTIVEGRKLNEKSAWLRIEVVEYKLVV